MPSGDLLFETCYLKQAFLKHTQTSEDPFEKKQHALTFKFRNYGNFAIPHGIHGTGIHIYPHFGLLIFMNKHVGQYTMLPWMRHSQVGKCLRGQTSSLEASRDTPGPRR